MANLLQPGSTAPYSGVFKVIHAERHAPDHYVIALYGETFPGCKDCLGKVRFEAAISAVYIKAHPFFASDR